MDKRQIKILAEAITSTCVHTIMSPEHPFYDAYRYGKQLGYLYVGLMVGEPDNPDRPPTYLFTMRRPDEVPKLVDTLTSLAEWPAEIMEKGIIEMRAKQGDEVELYRKNIAVVRKRRDRGGTPKRGVDPHTAEKYRKMERAYLDSGITNKSQFCKKYNYNRTTLNTALRYCAAHRKTRDR